MSMTRTELRSALEEAKTPEALASVLQELLKKKQIGGKAYAFTPILEERFRREAKEGNLTEETAGLLIQAGVDVNATNKYGETALMFAAESGHVDVVKALLKAGTDVFARNNEGQTAPSIAINKVNETYGNAEVWVWNVLRVEEAKQKAKQHLKAYLQRYPEHQEVLEELKEIFANRFDENGKKIKRVTGAAHPLAGFLKEKGISKQEKAIRARAVRAFMAQQVKGNHVQTIQKLISGLDRTGAMSGGQGKRVYNPRYIG